jgi:replicative DNA helicase
LKSNEIERALLAELLFDNKTIDATAEVLAPEDFSDISCRLSFGAALALWGKGHPADEVTVISELRRRGELDTVGGLQFFAQLESQGVPNVRSYAQLIKESALRRRFIALAQRAVTAGQSDTKSTAELIEAFSSQLFALASNQWHKTWVTSPDATEGVLPQLDTMLSGDPSVGVSTGYKDVDAVLGGLKKGEVLILAARPGTGKTSFALNVAHEVGRKAPVGFFSLEMTQDECTLRRYALEANVDFARLRRGAMSAAEKSVVIDNCEKAYPALLANQMHILDISRHTENTLYLNARRLKQQCPNVALFVVDYLQLVTCSTKANTRTEEVAVVTRALKAIAKELDVPILVLAQLSREVEKRGGKPRLSDLRESGSIEQDADVVMFLHEEADDSANRSATREVSLIIAKNRNGPVGEVPLVFFPTTTKFGQSSSRELHGRAG